MSVDEFIRRNADPIWLHQNEMWELIEVEPEPEWTRDSSYDPEHRPTTQKRPTIADDDEIPF